jgi:hypothetical protein
MLHKTLADIGCSRLPLTPTPLGLVSNHPLGEPSPEAILAFKVETAIPIGCNTTKVTATATKAMNRALTKLVPEGTAPSLQLRKLMPDGIAPAPIQPLPDGIANDCLEQNQPSKSAPQI